MKHVFPFLFLLLLLPASTLGQGRVEGPFPVPGDSIQVTIIGVKLSVIDAGRAFEELPSPRLEPTGSKKARRWFALGLLNDACSVRTVQRVDSDSTERGATVHNITFRCDYEDAELNSDIRDLMQQ
jgi:hypothetical protein